MLNIECLLAKIGAGTDENGQNLAKIVANIWQIFDRPSVPVDWWSCQRPAAVLLFPLWRSCKRLTRIRIFSDYFASNTQLSIRRLHWFSQSALRLSQTDLLILIPFSRSRGQMLSRARRRRRRHPHQEKRKKEEEEKKKKKEVVHERR